MRNIKADLPELFRWCIHSSHLAKSAIIIAVDSIIHSNWQSCLSTHPSSAGRQQGKTLAVTFGWDWWGQGAWLDAAGHWLCPAQPSDNPDLSLQTQSDLLSTKQPLTAMGLKNWRESTKPLKVWRAGALIYMHVGSGTERRRLSFYYSTIQKHVTIEALCIAI